MNQRITWRSRKAAMRRGVERVAGRRRVDDDQVVAIAGVQLGQLLDRHVLLRAGEAARQVLVETVAEDALADLRRRRVALDQRVPGALLIEHHGGERAAHRPEPLSLEHVGRDLTRLATEGGEAERGREAARRVDRDDDGPPAREGAPEADGGRDRRLADTAAAGGDDDTVAVDHLS
jgi:hypothetical protein